jgi:hypothetical protein
MAACQYPITTDFDCQLVVEPKGLDNCPANGRHAKDECSI